MTCLMNPDHSNSFEMFLVEIINKEIVACLVLAVVSCPKNRRGSEYLDCRGYSWLFVSVTCVCPHTPNAGFPPQYLICPPSGDGLLSHNNIPSLVFCPWEDPEKELCMCVSISLLTSSPNTARSFRCGALIIKTGGRRRESETKICMPPFHSPYKVQADFPIQAHSFRSKPSSFSRFKFLLIYCIFYVFQ